MPPRASSTGTARSALSRQLVAVGIVVVIAVAAGAGYFLLRPGTSSTSSQNQGAVTSGVGSSQDNPVSAFALYNDYQLGANATDYPQFTNHFLYARGNITSIVRYQKTNVTETQLQTGADLFEYWDWLSGTQLPVYAANQQVLAYCFVSGLMPSQNGTAYLYLDRCSLISIQGSKAGT